MHVTFMIYLFSVVIFELDNKIMLSVLVFCGVFRMLGVCVCAYNMVGSVQFIVPASVTSLNDCGAQTSDRPTKRPSVQMPKQKREIERVQFPRFMYTRQNVHTENAYIVCECE